MTDGLQKSKYRDIQISAMAPIWVEKKEGGKKGRMQERRKLRIYKCRSNNKSDRMRLEFIR